MAGKASYSFGVFRALATIRENRTERFIIELGRTQSAAGL
jgi:hypothetical protein